MLDVKEVITQCRDGIGSQTGQLWNALDELLLFSSSFTNRLGIKRYAFLRKMPEEKRKRQANFVPRFRMPYEKMCYCYVVQY
mmetsp:Transcript_30039/g.45344  ORF Transcript_30039/g.45344 Transcript_30039/m.45344 type:complete len:82 (-) Transcript_30039:3653-3898(-)